ncbi:hypothetical protein [Cupriavidus sp. 2TAF22]|uniref:hypothetical protein n=1 Tax=Cupriavidus sp. 2TAF22 TaxID=3233010 RepID=UPI003F9386B2
MPVATTVPRHRAACRPAAQAAPAFACADNSKGHAAVLFLAVRGMQDSPTLS